MMNLNNKCFQYRINEAKHNIHLEQSEDFISILNSVC